MQNILSLVLCLLLLIGCIDDKKEKHERLAQYYSDKSIKYKYDSLNFWFIKEYERINLKDVKVIHILQGQSLQLNLKYNQNDSKIIVKNIENLVTEDTIMFLLKNKMQINIYSFRNGSGYGGKNFLGCILSGHTINNIRREDAMYGTITVY
ncbi:hypothetical protein [Kaistella carnis]|uniref:hypothetical protein n=1 Tax=Kaistella carnis TaxID=1241979 RepID=UPI0028A98904|nr:hypothetical protein [Kaistella carnis]